MLLYLLTQEKTERGDNDHFDKGKSFYFISTSDTEGLGFEPRWRFLPQQFSRLCC